jgi:hypothetical protein
VSALHEIQAESIRMTALGLPPDQPIGMYMMGSGRPLLAVFDPAGAQIKALIRPD